VTCPRTDEQSRLLALEMLVGPRADALQPGAVVVHAAGLARERLGLLHKRARRCIHPCRDAVFRPDEIGGEPPPCCRVRRRIAGDASNGGLDVAVERDDAAVGKHLRVVDLGADQLEAEIGEPQFGRHGRQISELEAKGMHVRPETREREFLGRRHAADRMVLIEHERSQSGACQIASASQSVVAGANNNYIIRLHPSSHVEPRWRQGRLVSLSDFARFPHTIPDSLAESGHCWLEGGGPSGLGCLLKGKGVAEQLAVLPRLAEEG
jgi:hypothetical protein